VAPVFSWTGCYIGVHGGGGATRSDFTDAFFGEGRGSGSGSWGNGGLAGGQIGCNYQTGVLVLGIEGEGYWSGMKSRQEFSTTSSLSEGFTATAEARNKWDYTVAGRIGVAYERAFIYGKAGWAWGEYDFTATQTNFSGGSSETFTAAGNKTLNGPLFGIGVEYALTNNWTVKGEYNYINYGLSPVSLRETECFNGSCVVNPGTFSQSFSSEKHIFKFGVNYLFNVGGGPVVARY
jgi:outer membrane immunogenic protein